MNPFLISAMFVCYYFALLRCMSVVYLPVLAASLLASNWIRDFSGLYTTSF